MTDLLPISLEDQIACVKRELRLRTTTYPKWVAAKRLRQDAADREIAVMTAVLETLQGLRPTATPDAA